MTTKSGTPDLEFGNNGARIWDFPEFASIAPHAIVSLPDGRLVAVANEPGYPRGFVIVRLTEKGQLDAGTGFGVEQRGFARITIPEKHIVSILGSSLLSDGGFLIVLEYSWRPNENGLLVVRLLDDGSLNDKFGEGGVLVLPDRAVPATLSRGALRTARRSAGLDAVSVVQGGDNSGVRGIELPGGKIVLATFTYDPSSSQTKGSVIRLNPDGTLDKTFNKTGSTWVELGIAGDNAARGVAAQADGSLVVIGDYFDAGTFGTYVVRFKEDGVRDEEFPDVVLTSRYMPRFRDIAVRTKDGMIAIVGGQFEDNFPEGTGVIVVLNENGSPNLVFNEGKPLYSKLSPEKGQQWQSCAFGGAEDSKLIVAGTSGSGDIFYDTQAVCARYLLTGTLDKSFNTDKGWLAFSQPDRMASALDAVITSQGKIAICGELYKDELSLPVGGWIARYFS
ncbi:delta-60 repeat domain-containing protein [Pseudomonas siliginis]|uniref:delta-60 repeat domain-containing protein n=1 Tax=Pseudomonas siliginis TaxID=2842346 RepID=UPI0020938822|nr:delta-60 repeat domain-containing protein [Pseudomonas siliginis]UST90160.1 delta-60 repeat domain-containing protein [Pseudomonas siliginis]